MRDQPQKEHLSVGLLVVLGAILLVSSFIPRGSIGALIPAYYGSIHFALELVPVLVSFMIFAVGWATHHRVNSTSILFLSVSSVSVGLLDLGHAFSYVGMPDFFTPNSADKSIYLWLGGRFTDAISLLLVPLLPEAGQRFRKTRYYMMATALVWTGLYFYAVLNYLDRLPPMFVEGQGLTTLKIILEYLVMVIVMAAGILSFIRSRRQEFVCFKWLGCACMVFAMGGMYFTYYFAIDDFYNFLGHVYKAIGFVLLYRAVFLECVSRPYQKMAELAEEARCANATKSLFLANVSHEFRTPLGVICGYGDLLASSPNLNTESRLWADTVKKNAEQLKHLIDDLLDWTKAETGQISVKHSRFQLDEVVADVIAGFQLLAREKKLDLIVERDPSAPHTVSSDPLRLRQIMVNLIGNAIKFTESGHVTVRLGLQTDAQNTDRTLVVTVTDTGIGISKERAKLLFRPFSQGDSSMSRKYGGTGLGLAFSRKIANLLGGDAWLEKSSPGEGSTFKLMIPAGKALADDPQMATYAAAATPAPLADPLQGIRILLVDDSQDNRFLLSRYLSCAGAIVSTAANGLEGKAMALEHAFDMVFMDIQMPEKDGYQTVSELRTHGYFTPIVALTAHALKAERERALNSGFDEYLIKPVTRQELVDCVLQIVRTPKQTKSASRSFTRAADDSHSRL